MYVVVSLFIYIKKRESWLIFFWFFLYCHWFFFFFFFLRERETERETENWLMVQEARALGLMLRRILFMIQNHGVEHRVVVHIYVSMVERCTFFSSEMFSVPTNIYYIVLYIMQYQYSISEFIKARLSYDYHLSRWMLPVMQQPIMQPQYWFSQEI